jgi:lipopolysaccharide export system permease protein
LQDARKAGESTTFTARAALFVRGDSGPKLIMFDGMAQTLDVKGQRVAVTRFADFTYDLGALLTRSVGHRRTLSELVTSELLWPAPAVLDETRATAGALRFEAHQRLAEPVLSVAVALIGFAALLLGGFSRLGLWRQIGFAVTLLVIVQGVNTVAGQIGEDLALGWVLAYAAPILALGIAAGLLGWAGRNRPVPRTVAA